MNEKMADMPEQAAQNPDAGERTFTQEDVNRIVGERLAKEKSKAEAALAQREKELEARELRQTARETLAEKGLPVALLDAINCGSAEALDNSISLLEKAFEEKKAAANTDHTPTFVMGAMPHGTALRSDSLRDAMRLP